MARKGFRAAPMDMEIGCNVHFLPDNHRPPRMVVFRNHAETFPADQSPGDSADRIHHTGPDNNTGTEQLRGLSFARCSSHRVADIGIDTGARNNCSDVTVSQDSQRIPDCQSEH